MTVPLTRRPADLLILDCDGVIVDSEGPSRAVLAAFFAERGFAIAADEVHGLFTGGTLRTAAAEAVRRGAVLEDAWFEALTDLMFDRLRQGVPLVPGAVDLIDRAEAAGMVVAVASNGAMPKMEITLGPHGLWHRLAGRIWSAYEHGAAKPAPDLLIRAAREAGVPLGRSVMVDDSPAGCGAARAARVRCFGYAVEGQGAALAATGAEVVSRMDTVAAALRI